MPKVLFTPIATEDLQQIWDYLAHEADEETADRFLSKIEEKCNMIARFPESYRLRPELLPQLRSFPFKNYVIFYVPIKSGIEVFRILHGSRDIERVFEN